jgi:hypothetical protein
LPRHNEIQEHEIHDLGKVQEERRINLLHKERTMNARQLLARFATVLLVVSAISFAQTPTVPRSADKPLSQDTILKAADINAHLFPTTVFFRGQTATSQMDNSGGVRYADGLMVLAALVDNSGYSSQIRVKYQAYLIAEVPIQIGGETLNPGAYGFGFLDDNKFVVMDIGAQEVLHATSTRDADMHRPMPLQFVATPDASTYRLYHGRDYIEFHRSAGPRDVDQK